MRALIIAAAILLAAPTVASARLPLTQRMADTEAHSALDAGIGYDDWSGFYGATPVSYELDPCELGRFRAVCDFTMTFSDADVCDGTVEVWRSRRGRVLSNTSLDYCDSDEGTE